MEKRQDRPKHAASIVQFSAYNQQQGKQEKKKSTIDTHVWEIHMEISSLR